MVLHIYLSEDSISNLPEELLICRMSRKLYFGAADEIELKYVNRYVIYTKRLFYPFRLTGGDGSYGSNLTLMKCVK